jgi:hypothetical protein
MDRFTFLHLVSHPEMLLTADVDALEKVAKNFPYCQTTYMLLAKASHKAGSMLANKKLKTAAAYAANRVVLKRIINDEYPFQSQQEPTVVLALQPKVEILSAQEVFEEINATEVDSAFFAAEEAVIALAEVTPLETQVAETAISEPNTNATAIADEIANNLLFWHDMRLKAAEFWKQNNAANEGVNESSVSSEMFAQDEDLSPIATEQFESFVDEIISDTFIEESFPYQTTLTEVPLAYEVVETIAEGDINLTTDFFIDTNAAITETEKSPQEAPILVSYLFDWSDFKNITTEIELDNHNENELLLEYLLTIKKEKKKQRLLSVDKKEIQDEIIDNFIKLKPGISRVSKQEINNLQSNNKDLSLKSTVQNNNLISETLAKIMVKQKKISSAIEMYHKLILKYPEKKTYFVGIIQSLEEK